MKAFDSIEISGEMHIARPRNYSHGQSFDAYCEQARKIGITHIQVNFLADMYHQLSIEQPDNYYLWFATYGPSLDQFISSKLNRGTYLEANLAKNRAVLIESAQIAVKHGLKPILMLCEPRFVSERFFAMHPHLRGPRVDNPACSNVPLYALCTDTQEVQEHYKEMMIRLMEHVPELAGISIFTNDCGAGFCFSKNLYPGPNGPLICRGTNVGKRIADFCKLLKNSGAAINPEFEVHIVTAVDGQERLDFLANATAGITGHVQGLWSWLGGLEDYCSYWQYQDKIDNVGQEKARQERIEDFKQRKAYVDRHGLKAVAVCSMPTDGYYAPLRYVPHPFQNIEVLKEIKTMGFRHLHCKGDMTNPPLIVHDINNAVFGMFQKNPDLSAGEMINSMATQWVGGESAGELIKAWKIIDTVHRNKPMWFWAFAREPQFMPAPLVPDPKSLPDYESDYYYHAAIADRNSVIGRHILDSICRPEDRRAWIINKYMKEIIPDINNAVQIMESLAAKSTTEDVRKIIIEQAEHIKHFGLWQHSMFNWLEAGCYLMPSNGTPKPVRTMPEIIKDEIKVTDEMINLLQDRVEVFLDISPIEGTYYEKWPNFVQQLHERKKVMQAHLLDQPCNQKDNMKLD